MQMNRRRIGLMGGTFNPVHIAHINIARQALPLVPLDEVWFIPTGDPPHKRKDIAPAAHRLAMVRLAIEKEPVFHASAVEIERPGKTYTVDTLRILTRLHPDADFFYLIGSDTLFELENWRDFPSIAELCAFAVFARPPAPEPWIVAAKRRLEALYQANIQLMPFTERELSSTEIRKRVALGRSLKGMLPPQVEQYIRAHGLYVPNIPEVPS